VKPQRVIHLSISKSACHFPRHHGLDSVVYADFQLSMDCRIKSGNDEQSSETLQKMSPG
jgi:hypothetical protein